MSDEIKGGPVAWMFIGDDGHKHFSYSKQTPEHKPLYTHADSGEVERLHKENERLRLNISEMNDEAKTRDAQIAERDALISAAVAGYDSNESFDPEMEALRAALSASAEPSAPVERDERADFEAHRKSLGLCVKRLAGHPDLYESQAANGGWEAWQARAALEGKNHG